MPKCISNSYNTSAGKLCNVIVICLCCKVWIQNSLIIHTTQPSEIFFFFITHMLVNAVIVIINKPGTVIRCTISNKSSGITECNEPVPVSSTHGNTNGIQTIIGFRMCCQVLLDQGFILLQSLRIFIIIFLKSCVLYLAVSSGCQNLVSYTSIRKLIYSFISRTPFQLFKLIAVHFFNIWTIFLDQICHINKCTCLIQTVYTLLSINHIWIFVLSNHQRYILVRIACTGYRIGNIQSHTCGFSNRLSNRIFPVTIFSVCIVVLESYR